jgi:hypothetical protein
MIISWRIEIEKASCGLGGRKLSYPTSTPVESCADTLTLIGSTRSLQMGYMAMPRTPKPNISSSATMRGCKH